MKETAKSIGAILSGLMIVVILSNGTDYGLQFLGIFPDVGQGKFEVWMYIVAVIYRTIYSIMAGYITAAIAPNQPMKKVFILGILGTIAATLGILAAIANEMTIWYPALLAIFAFPSVWLGGKLQ